MLSCLLLVRRYIRYESVRRPGGELLDHKHHVLSLRSLVHGLYILRSITPLNMAWAPYCRHNYYYYSVVTSLLACSRVFLSVRCDWMSYFCELDAYYQQRAAEAISSENRQPLQPVREAMRRPSGAGLGAVQTAADRVAIRWVWVVSDVGENWTMDLNSTLLCASSPCAEQ